MDHIHNETVLTFLREHKDNPNVAGFLKKQDQAIDTMNKELGTDYKDYLNYLEANIGDDANFTVSDLKALLTPTFHVKLLNKEKQEFGYDEFDVRVDELIKPVYIKDEGDFFTVWGKNGRVDVPVRLLKKFVKFLRENKVVYESEYDF